VLDAGEIDAAQIKKGHPTFIKRKKNNVERNYGGRAEGKSCAGFKDSLLPEEKELEL